MRIAEPKEMLIYLLNQPEKSDSFDLGNLQLKCTYKSKSHPVYHEWKALFHPHKNISGVFLRGNFASIIMNSTK